MNVESYSLDIRKVYFREEPDESMLEYIRQYLPTDKVNVKFEENAESTLDLIGDWSIDQDNSCYTNHVNKEALPPHRFDPDNILDNNNISYTVGEFNYYLYNVNMYVIPNAREIKEDDSFSIEVTTESYDCDEFYVLKISDDNGQKSYEIIYTMSEDTDAHEIDDNEYVTIISKKAVKSDEADYAMVAFRYGQVCVTRLKRVNVAHAYDKGIVTKEASCSSEGEIITAQEIIPATGHTEVKDKAVEPTCTEAGLTEGSHCSVFGEIIKAQEIIPATGHTEVKDKAVEPTCTETGLTEGSHCSVCGEVIIAQEIIPAKGHAEIGDKAVEPTCTEAGLTEGSHCSVCGEVIEPQEIIPAIGHSFIDGVCEVCGKHENKETGDPKKETSDPEKDGVLIGDLNNDDKVTAKDSMIVQRYAIRLIKLDEKQIFAADANGDGKVTASDALQILRYSVHLKANERVGKVLEYK